MSDKGRMKPLPAAGLVGEDPPPLWGGVRGPTCSVTQKRLS